VNVIADIDGKTDAVILRELMGEEQFDRAVKAGLNLGDMSALYTEINGEGDEPSLGKSAGSSES
jgi:hypothetical protein